MRFSKNIFLISLIFSFTAILTWNFFGPPGNSLSIEIFTIPERGDDFNTVKTLKKNGFIKSEVAFQILSSVIGKTPVFTPGGYKLNKRMAAWEILKTLSAKPSLVWITSTGCMRKEQIGEILENKLEWNKDKLDQWKRLYADEKSEYFEGVYYPDTYLIPVDEPVDQVAKRFINRFNDEFTPYSDKYLKANIKWTTGLKIASLIAREAAGENDMRLISGIIWNRLNIGMPLQIDATMQYTLGKQRGIWWGNIDLTEKQNASPYNSYLHKGLPPTPICNPSIEYIEAALDPEKTSCLYYLHDRNKKIHCSDTYEGHLENIKKYLN